MRFLSRIVYLLGQKLRNPSLETVYKELKVSETYTLQELKDLQFARLKEIIQFAYRNSSYYQRVFNDVAYNPNTFITKEQLKDLPILTKKDVIKYNTEIHTVPDTKIGKSFRASTSGTTGDSLTFIKDEYTDSFNRASIYRGYSWYNVKPWEYSGYFWGFNFSFYQKIKTRFIDFLLNRFRLFSYDDKNLLKFVKKLQKATFIEGYSSMIFQAAKLINKKQVVKPNNIKMVKGTSEKIFASYQQEVIKAFGIKMISEYGAAETGIIAFECPQGNMHINMEGVYVEEIEGRIIVTNLVMKSFPVIRYDLGDFVELEDENVTCSCGMSHPIIREINGRVGTNIFGLKNMYPSLTFYYIFKNISKNRNITLTYQVIQKQKGYLEFKISGKLSQRERKILEAEIIKYFKDDMIFEIIDNQSFFENRDKKFKSFESYV